MAVVADSKIRLFSYIYGLNGIVFVEVIFDDPKEEKNCKDDKSIRKAYGDDAKIITKRLQDLRKFVNLQDYRANAGGKPHNLEGNYKGCVGVNTTASKRIIFKPTTEVPTDENGSPDYKAVISVTILAVNLNYHGK